MDTKNRILSIMKSTFSNSKIDLNSNIHNTENWDSINFLLLIVRLEDEFSVKFKPDEIAEMNSFTTIHESLRKKELNSH